MILYNQLVKELKLDFFICHESKYKLQRGNRYLDRFICKHKALTPELIVINDQPQGFRRVKNHLASLEEFPIQCEIEYFLSAEMDDEYIVEGFELFSETKTSLTGKMKDIEKICKKWQTFITIDRSKSINPQKDDDSTLLISSTFGELIYEHFYEEELERDVINEASLKRLIHQQFEAFSKTLLELNTLLYDSNDSSES